MDESDYTCILVYLTEELPESCGNYAYDYAIVRGTAYVAALDDFKEGYATKLEVYKLADLAKWQEAAEVFQVENDCDWEEAIEETRPSKYVT